MATSARRTIDRAPRNAGWARGCLAGAVAILAGASWLPAAEVVGAASRAANGVDMGDAESHADAIAADGRFIVLLSEADNLIPGQVESDQSHLFLFDRVSKSMTMISRATGIENQPANASSQNAHVSADGQYVAFETYATNILASDFVEDSNESLDVYLWELRSNVVFLVSKSKDSSFPVSKAANGSSQVVDISADGRYVLFRTSATDSQGVTSDSNGSEEDLLLWDRLNTETALLVSHADGAAGTTANAGIVSAALSADGNWVAFSSVADDLVDGITDETGFLDVFLWDRSAAAASATRLLSRSESSATTAANGDSDRLVISADGAEVAFVSAATDLEGMTNDPNGGDHDLFQYDRAGDVVRLVSRNGTSATESGNSEVSDSGFSISADGERIVYTSSSTDVFDNQSDTNGSTDVFLWTRNDASSTIVSHADGEIAQTGNNGSSQARISGDGSTVAFTSEATDLVAGVTDENSNADVFRWSRPSDTMVLVSRAFDDALATGADGSSGNPLIGSSGRYLACTSIAVDLVEVDLNAAFDAFYFSPDELFADGFESGNPDAWSSAVE